MRECILVHKKIAARSWLLTLEEVKRKFKLFALTNTVERFIIFGHALIWKYIPKPRQVESVPIVSLILARIR